MLPNLCLIKDKQFSYCKWTRKSKLQFNHLEVNFVVLRLEIGESWAVFGMRILEMRKNVVKAVDTVVGSNKEIVVGRQIVDINVSNGREKLLRFWLGFKIPKVNKQCIERGTYNQYNLYNHLIKTLGAKSPRLFRVFQLVLIRLMSFSFRML